MYRPLKTMIFSVAIATPLAGALAQVTNPTNPNPTDPVANQPAQPVPGQAPAGTKTPNKAPQAGPNTTAPNSGTRALTPGSPKSTAPTTEDPATNYRNGG